MFKAMLNDARRLRDVFNIVSTLLEEAEFMASAQGLILRAMDNSQVAMVDLYLPSTFFDEYECSMSSEYVRINLKTVLKILEDVGARESIFVNYLDEQARLTIRLRDEYERVFSLSTLSAEGRLAKEPTATFKAKAQLKTASLKRVITDCQKVGEHIIIETKSDGISFRSAGLVGNTVSSFKRGDTSLAELSCDEESKAVYSLELLGAIIKNASPAAEQTVIEYSTNNILRVDFVVPQGKLHFYLSPMLEEPET